MSLVQGQIEHLVRLETSFFVLAENKAEPTVTRKRQENSTAYGREGRGRREALSEVAEGQPGAQWKHTAPRDSCVWDPAVTQLKELSKPRDLVPYQDRKEHQWEILKQIWEEAKEEHGRSVCGEDEPRAPADLEREEYKSQLSFCHNTKLMWLQFLMEASQQEEKQSQPGYLCSPEQGEGSDGAKLCALNVRIWTRVCGCHVGIRKWCSPRQRANSSPVPRRNHTREEGMIKVCAI